MSTLTDLFKSNEARCNSTIKEVLFLTNQLLKDTTVLEALLEPVKFSVYELARQKSSELLDKEITPYVSKIHEHVYAQLPESERQTKEDIETLTFISQNRFLLLPMNHAMAATASLYLGKTNVVHNALRSHKGRYVMLRTGAWEPANQTYGLENVQRYLADYSGRIETAVADKNYEDSADLAMGLIGVAATLEKIASSQNIHTFESWRIQARTMQQQAYEMSGLSGSLYVIMAQHKVREKVMQ